MTYKNFNLRDWPFRTSADVNYASVWAGRAKTKEQLNRLIRKMAFNPKSGLHIFWANFGMGKTHTLYHLQYLSQQTNGQIIPIYAVMPKRSTGFIELYREIMQSFLSSEMREYLGRQLVDLAQNAKGASVALNPMFSKSPGVVRALLAMRGGDIEETTAAMQWLTAQPGLSSHAMRSIGVTYRIRTPEDGISALSALLSLVTWGGRQPKHALLMIDEFQRIGELKPNIISQVNSSLHTVFNAQPTGLQLLLTFSFGVKDNLNYLLSDELKSQAEPQSIYLDVMTQSESFEFIRDLFAQFRLEKDDWGVYPFSPEAVQQIICYIASKKSLTPRRLMTYFNHILSEFMLDQEQDYRTNRNGVVYEEIRKYLTDPALGNIDTDEPNE